MANLQRNGEKERFWRGVLSQYALSGLSVRAFCQGEGLAVSQFYRWRRTIGLRDGVVAKPPSFVPVLVAGQSAGASSIALELIGGRVLRLLSGLNVKQRNVTMETPMRLRPFPFDTQTLEAKMIAFGNHSGQVLLEVDKRELGATEEHVKRDERVNIAQWRLLNLNMETGVSDYRYYGTPEPLSEIRLLVTLQRLSANIVWKVIVPLIVLVLLMWAVFWMEVDNLSDRLNVAFIGILTIVAYQFLIDGAMPRIPYFTFTDTVLLFSFLVMCLAVVESLALYSLCKAGSREAAERMDRAAQWAFPLIYFAGLLVSYFYYMNLY
jgi:hypothetical protein